MSGSFRAIRGIFQALTLSVPVLAIAPALADEELIAYGAYLSGECVTCHRADGEGAGVPPIIGLSEDAFVAALQAYRTGARTNAAMISAAQALDDGQIEALAAYFASLTID